MRSNDIREKLKELLSSVPVETKTGIEKLVYDLKKENSTLFEYLDTRNTEYDKLQRDLNATLAKAHTAEENLKQKLHEKEVTITKLQETVEVGAQEQKSYVDHNSLKAVENGYLQIKCKCMQCSLHFIICTWYEDLHTLDTIHCPECGQKDGTYLLWKEFRKKEFIFQAVPGNSAIAAIKVK